MLIIRMAAPKAINSDSIGPIELFDTLNDCHCLSWRIFICPTAFFAPVFPSKHLFSDSFFFCWPTFERQRKKKTRKSRNKLGYFLGEESLIKYFIITIRSAIRRPLRPAHRSSDARSSDAIEH